MSDILERIKAILVGADERGLDETECRVMRDAAAEIERLRAPSVRDEAPVVMDADAHWAAGYEQAEIDILDLLEIRAHDPWPDSQWPAANQVLMQMIAEIEANEHREWEDEP